MTITRTEAAAALRSAGFEELAYVIGNSCWPRIWECVLPIRAQVFPIITGWDLPSEWAYQWARNIGDIEVMRGRITDPYWAEILDQNLGSGQAWDAEMKAPDWELHENS